MLCKVFSFYCKYFSLCICVIMPSIQSKFVRLSVLTMTNPEVKCYCLYILRWLMRQILALSCLLQIEQERSEEKRYFGDALALGFRWIFADSLCFVVISTPSYEASPLCSILCNLFPRLCWYVEVFKGGFEDVLVSLLYTTMGAFFHL